MMRHDQMVDRVARWLQTMTMVDNGEVLNDSEALTLAADLIDYIEDWLREEVMRSTKPYLNTFLFLAAVILFFL